MDFFMEQNSFCWIEKDYPADDGMVLHYGEAGKEGTALVLIHGQGMSLFDYDKVLPYLAKDYHVFAIDCPGHGKSSKNNKYYNCKAIGDSICGFIRTVVQEPCLVSGHSSGGILAAYIAGTEKNFVKGALLEDPPFFKVQPEEMQNTFVWKDSFSLIHNYLENKEEEKYILYYLKNSYIFNLFGSRLISRIYDEAKKSLEENPDKLPTTRYVSEKNLHGFAYFNDFDLAFSESFYNGSWFEGVDQEEILENIQCPAVYLKAKTKYGKDGVLWAANSDEDAEKMTDLIKDCKRINIRCGHDIHYLKPKAFYKAVEQLKKMTE